MLRLKNLARKGLNVPLLEKSKFKVAVNLGS